jgi:4-amino-4-deoxychorismate lyase
MIFYDRGEYREDRLSLAVDGPAFRYGFGFFETIFWDGQGPCRLDLHLKRLEASCAAFGLPFAPGDIAQVVGNVAMRNGLRGMTARANVIVPVDGPGPYRPVVTVQAYTPPPADRALSLGLSPRPLHAWLGAFKSANHLHHHLEHRAALDAGRDGMAMAAPGGWLLEAAHATLVFAANGALATPAPPSPPDAPDAFDETAPALLPGTALAAAREALDIESRPIHLDELPGFENAWALNSLMGMRCVDRIGEVPFAADTAPIAAAEARIRAR